MYDELIKFIRSIYPDSSTIPLHEPSLSDKEKNCLIEAINSTFVSSVGHFVDKFEESLCEITNAKHAIATINGTSALHTALLLAGVGKDDLVITQPLTFVATCNAIAYCGAEPIFIDVDQDSLSLSPKNLEQWLSEHTNIKGNVCYEKSTNRVIKACVPVHILGHPARSSQIVKLCNLYNIPVIEDAAEALGSYAENGNHVGLDGVSSIISFNGNKIVTAGCGGAVITNNDDFAKKAKHITTTAKHSGYNDFYHDQLGYNYRLSNINAAVGYAQLQKLSDFLKVKRALAQKYMDFFQNNSLEFFSERYSTNANYWLNAVFTKSSSDRNELLQILNDNGVFARPIWRLMVDLPMYNHCIKDELSNARKITEIAVCLPSSVPTKKI